MNAYMHLMWKEYRAIRWFWIAIVLLVVLLQFLAAHTVDSTTLLVLHIAFAAPVLFAAGAAGTSFAAEKEEGTYDFLCASPITSRQVFGSKLCLIILATALMIVAMWPITTMHVNLPQIKTGQLEGLAGLWLVGAIEIVAWGTLFSLITARPLLSVILAFVMTAIVAQLTLPLAMSFDSRRGWDLAMYFNLAPYRLAIAACVFLADIAIGLNWLRNSPSKYYLKTFPGALQDRAPAMLYDDAPATAAARQWPQRRSHLVMLGRLSWQYARQSLWMTGLLMLLFFALTTSTLFSRSHHLLGFQELFSILIWTALVAALMGALVFHADQSGSGFRFFVEHNVPPRYVWLSRQLPWMGALCTLLFINVLGWPYVNDANSGKNVPSNQCTLLLEVLIAITAYASGQWLSMLVRSGLMAGFFSLLLTAFFGGWIALMQWMEISPLWSILPIPIVLLFATWLRAPDWIRENKTWSARFRAAGAVLVPMIILCMVVPLYRVHQIPLVSPGFDLNQFEQEITPDALAAGELYRKAADQFLPFDTSRDTIQPNDPKSPLRLEIWLEENQAALALLLEASRHENCFFGNPTKESALPELPKAQELVSLVLESGSRLEREGSLEEAFDRYVDAFRVQRHFIQLSNYTPAASTAGFTQIAQWGGVKEQQTATLRAAIAKLQAIDGDFLPLRSTIKSNYVYVRRILQGDSNIENELLKYSDQVEVRTAILWGRLMPWENIRALRLLNQITAASLSKTEQLQQTLKGDTAFTSAISQDFILPAINIIPAVEFQRRLTDVSATASRAEAGDYRSEAYSDDLRMKSKWTRTTLPNLAGIAAVRVRLGFDAINFETERRATLAILAAQAYRVETGKLPENLNQVVSKYLGAIPCDPLTGEPFAIATSPHAFISAGRQVFSIPPFDKQTPRALPAPIPESAPPGDAPNPDLPADSQAIENQNPTSSPPSPASPGQTSDDAADGLPPRLGNLPR